MATTAAAPNEDVLRTGGDIDNGGATLGDTSGSSAFRPRGAFLNSCVSNFCCSPDGKCSDPEGKFPGDSVS